MYPKAALFSYSFIYNFVFSFITKLVTVVKLSLFIISTYPMRHWCIPQKYTFRPLLLLQLVPCHHISREMYLQPSRLQMHANSASRRNSRFVPQGKASFLKSSSNFCCSPLLRSLWNLNKYRAALKLNNVIRTEVSRKKKTLFETKSSDELCQHWVYCLFDGIKTQEGSKI